jgi:peptide/nickel transport system permease protein
MGLGSFIGRRLLFSLIVIIAEIIFIYVLIYIASPDPAIIWAGRDATQDQIAQIASQYHLNDPLYVQIYYYLISFFSGNWGISPQYHQPVLQLITFYLPVTIELAVLAFIFKVVTEVILGIISAMRPNGKIDNTIKIFYTTIRSAPPFLLALGLLIIFSFQLHWLPSSQPIDPLMSVPQFKIYNPFTGKFYPFWLFDNMPILNSFLVGDWSAFLSSIVHAILPVAALVLLGYGGIVRLVKVSMLEVLQQDFVRTARGKGLKERAVILRHALRNSLLPAFTLMGLVFAGLVTGSLVVETIFDYAGLGWYLGFSLLDFDTPSLIAGTMLVTITIVLLNLATDIGYGFLDPRTASS